MNRHEIIALAYKAQTDPKVARGAFKRLAMAEGYKGAVGGWIYYRDQRKAVAQGWQCLADLVVRGYVRFSLAEARETVEATRNARAVETMAQQMAARVIELRGGAR